MQKSSSNVCPREIWISLFDESIITSNDIADDEDFQGLLMLLEIAFSKTKRLSLSNYNLKSSNQKVLSELEWKTQECNKLKIDIARLENTPCQKCSSLEAEIKYFKKKANEAQNRMKSIANILKLGENIEESQSPRKNSAFNLVSQMLLEPSPKRKKRCITERSFQKEAEEIIENEVVDDVTVIPETLPPLDIDMLQTKPHKKPESTEIIMSPGDSPTVKIPQSGSSKPSFNFNLPMPKRSPSHAKKNLSSQFLDSVTISSKTPSKEAANEGIKSSPMGLDASLAEYVKEANSELDKIWFTVESCKSSKSGCEEQSLSPKEDLLVGGTPRRSPQKKKAIWKMKGIRGMSERVGSKTLRQMTLSVKHKQKVKDVDLSTMTGYDGGSSLVQADKSFSPEDRSSQERNVVEISADDSPDLNTDVFKPKTTSTEIDDFGLQKNCPETTEVDSELNTNAFKPKNTSTQIENHVLQKKREDSPKYVYKRDTVRKKSERAKLAGWDCDNCAKYYAALGVTSPSKLKGRLNKCSRHRDNFNPKTNTPPGYWDPLFPSTEECKEKGFYVSYCRKE